MVAIVVNIVACGDCSNCLAFGFWGCLTIFTGHSAGFLYSFLYTQKLISNSIMLFLRTLNLQSENTVLLGVSNILKLASHSGQTSLTISSDLDVFATYLNLGSVNNGTPDLERYV